MAIVWMPMVPGDDRTAASEEAARFPAVRSGHFWDAERTTGRTLSLHLFALHAVELRTAVRDIPELVEHVDIWRAHPEQAPPAWDCALFYGPNSRWAEPLPNPVAWTKQFEFWTSGDGAEVGGKFWRRRSPTELIESSWKREMESGMRRLIHASRSESPAAPLERASSVEGVVAPFSAHAPAEAH